MNKFKLRIFLYSTIFISLIGIMIYSCFNYWGQIDTNKQMVLELETKYNSLLEKEDDLENEVVKLQDKEYVAKYAREKYLYTKEGELIIDMSALADNK